MCILVPSVTARGRFSADSQGAVQAATSRSFRTPSIRKQTWLLTAAVSTVHTQGAKSRENNQKSPKLDRLVGSSSRNSRNLGILGTRALITMITVMSKTIKMSVFTCSFNCTSSCRYRYRCRQLQLQFYLQLLLLLLCYSYCCIGAAAFAADTLVTVVVLVVIGPLQNQNLLKNLDLSAKQARQLYLQRPKRVAL